MWHLRRIAVSCLGVLGPFLLSSQRLLHPAPWILFGVALVIQLTLPRASKQDMQQASEDGGSAAWILLVGNLVVVVPVWEFVLRPELRPDPLSPWVWWGGAALVGGAALRVWAIWALGGAFTGVVQTQSDQPLVDSGPYRLLRHPSYAAMLLGFLGEAAMMQSLWGLGLILLAMLPVYLYRIRLEEQALLRHFGPRYHRYQQNTWALVPWIY